MHKFTELLVNPLEEIFIVSIFALVIAAHTIQNSRLLFILRKASNSCQNVTITARIVHETPV